MINKIIEEVKEAENLADKIIKEAEDRAIKIIKEAQLDAEKNKEQAKKETLAKGELMIVKEEKMAREEAKNIIDKSIKEREIINKKAMAKIDKAVEIIIKRVVEL
ncbi:MAG TPA: hypothetical protein ENG48_01175 [Candidatus Atribacteria bacterium]|nr:hypothetical protein [bacterium]HDK25685.1 hypothetical protein [Candidatus Atribacteria bacterium]